MSRRLVAVVAVFAVVFGAAYWATGQPIGPVGLGRVSHDTSMTGSGTTANPLAVDTSIIQSRVSGTCSAPESIRVIASNGTVTCTSGTGDITGVTAGSGLSGGGTSGAVTVAVGAGSGILAAGSTTAVNLGAGLTFSTGAIVPNLTGASCGAGSAMTALSSAGAGTCTGLVAGTSGRSTRFSSATAIGNGAFTDDGTNATIAGTLTANGDINLGDGAGDDTIVSGDTFRSDTTSSTLRSTTVTLGSTPTTTVNIGGNVGASSIAFTNGPAGINLYEGKHFEWTEEFQSSGAVAASTPIGGGMFVWASNTATFTANPMAGRFGVHALDTLLGTAASSHYVRFLTSAFLDLGSTTTISAYLTSQFDTLSSSSNSVASMYLARFGWTDEASSSSSSDVTNGIYLMYDKGNTATAGPNASNLDRWSCWSANAGTRTKYLINGTGNSDESFALGTASVAAATWARLRIKITTTAGTPTRAEFYTVASGGVETKVCDINTNLPSASTLLGLNVTLLPKAATGAASRKWNLDQVTMSYDAAAQRSP